ncbi:hemolysin-III related-domain-containing protein [Pholiota molesta]|nr:hemolysin-III related-domain-containing protein [Pholiota molesta]
MSSATTTTAATTATMSSLTVVATDARPSCAASISPPPPPPDPRPPALPVLSYLADLEQRLRAALASARRDTPMEDAVQWARTALDMLEGIRADVCSHLPELPTADLSAMEALLRALPDFPDVPNFAELRAHLPDMPHLPDMADLSEMGSGMYSRLDDVRARFHELDFRGPFGFLPRVARWDRRVFVPNTVLSGLLDALLNSDVIADILNSRPADVICESEDMIERAALEVAHAVKRSFKGMRLIKYSDLPHPWRNNPFVTHGYRFIPIEQWHLIVKSLVMPHNELCTKHPHASYSLPLWGINLITLVLTVPDHADAFDLPEILFMCFALMCLSSSAIWHTMSGCADHRSVELCARIDYVGIGWCRECGHGRALRFGCHPSVGRAFLGLCFATGLAGNVFPFMSWFNKHEYRFYRIGFFLTLAFSGIGPMAALWVLHTRGRCMSFPVFPSLLSYIIGLVFYAAHFPECVIPASVQRKLDMVGGGSHAIWHCFIVLAVSQHRTAMAHMKGGLECLLPVAS